MDECLYQGFSLNWGRNEVEVGVHIYAKLAVVGRKQRFSKQSQGTKGIWFKSATHTLKKLRKNEVNSSL